MKYILITGGQGYIGFTTLLKLLNDNKKVIIVDKRFNNKIKNKNLIKLQVGICDYKKFYEKIKKYKIDLIYHFAAEISVAESEKKPLKYFKNNVIGTNNVIKILAEKKIKKIIYSSTCAVYKETKFFKVNENHIIQPKSIYGITKYMGEKLIEKNSKKNKYNYIILRYFNVVGAEEKIQSGPLIRGSLFKELSTNIVNKKFYINIFGKNFKTSDGYARRDFIDVNDLVDLHLLASKKFYKKNLILNLGYGLTYSVKQIVDIFSKLIGKTIVVKIKQTRKGDISSIFSDTKKLRRCFPNWKRKFTISESIKNSLRWEKKQSKLFNR